MKRFILLFITIVTLFSLTSCTYDVSTKVRATSDEVEEFILGKELPFENGEASFVITTKSKANDKDESIKGSSSTSYKIYGTLDEDKVGSYAYEAKSTFKYVTIDLNRKNKENVTYIEDGKVFLKEDSSENKMYFTVKSKIKITDGKINNKTLKTTLPAETNLYSSVQIQINGLFSLLSGLRNYSSKSFYYIEDHKIKIVTSTSSSHTETVLVFDNDVLERYYYEYKDATQTITKEVVFKDVKEINYPKNTDDYRK